MQANPDNPQAVCFVINSNYVIMKFTFDNTSIHCDHSVVGSLFIVIEFDHSIMFSIHVAETCKKSARKLWQF